MGKKYLLFIAFCKYIALLAINDRERLLKEVSLMITFNHPNVMPLIGLSFDGETPLIIMPFMSNGTVLGYVREHKENLYFLQSTDNMQVGKVVRGPVYSYSYHLYLG